jgi:hypothetical protein
MRNEAHLETSLTFAPPGAITPHSKPLLDADTFRDEHEHFVISDPVLASRLKKLAMQEMSLAKVLIGSASIKDAVEFFWIDVKKAKKEIAKLQKLMSQRWVELLFEFEMKRNANSGSVLTSDISQEAAALEKFLLLRRFLLNGLHPNVLRKKKRSILLFHHLDANAPRPQ